MFIPVMKNNGQNVVYSLDVDKEMAYDFLNQIRMDNEHVIGSSLYIDRNLSKIETIIERMGDPIFEKICFGLNDLSGLVIDLEDLIEDKENLDLQDLVEFKEKNPSLYYLMNIINSENSTLAKEEENHEIYSYFEEEWMKEVARQNSACLLTLANGAYQKQSTKSYKRK